MADLISMLPDGLQKLLANGADTKQLFLIAMSPIFLLAIPIEYWIQRRRGQTPSFSRREFVANMTLGTTYQVFEAIVFVFFTSFIFSWFYSHRLMDISVSIWTAIPIFVAVEFSFYWMHRSAHRVRWFWTAHVPHHTGKHMNFSTAARQSLLNAFVGSWIFYIPWCLLGIDPAAIFFSLALNLAYQYFIHTEAVHKLPVWVEAVFNTPSHHRVHHGRNPEYIDKNYGGTLIVFDRLFGTFEPEVNKPEYGITHQINSYNLVVLNMHELIDMIRDFAAPGLFTQRIKHLLMPPDWERKGHRSIRTWPLEEGHATTPVECAQADPKLIVKVH